MSASTFAVSFGSASLRTVMSLRSLLACVLAVVALAATPRAQAQAVSAGALDTSFGRAVTFQAQNKVLSIAAQPDGKLVIGGNFTSFNGVAVDRITRINADGSLDSTFNSAGSLGQVQAVAVQPDGKIVIGGLFSTVGGASALNIARLNADGSRDTSFTTTVSGQPNAIAVDANGKILVGGTINNVSGTAVTRLVRLNSDGTLDSTFAPAPSGAVSAIALQPDGKILVGGLFTTIGSGTSVARNRVARLNEDGTVDTSFDPGTGANGDVSSIALQSDGTMAIGGSFTAIGGIARFRVAKLTSTGALDTGFAPSTGANNAVVSVAVQADGKVVLGGSFATVEGTSRSGVARLNANGTLDTDFNPGTGVTGGATAVYALLIQSSGKVVVGGDFAAFNGVVRNNMARLNTNGTDAEAAYWGALGGQVAAIAMQSDGKLIVGGTFTTFSSAAKPYIVRLNADSSLDSSFTTGTGPNAAVNSIALQSDGKILIAGNFTTYAGVARSRIARLNSDGTLDTSFDPGTGPNAVLNAVAVDANGKVVIGGAFTLLNGATPAYIARLNADGTVDAGFTVGAGAVGGFVNAIAVQSDGKLLVGGNFTTISGASRGRIARLNADGTPDTTFTTGTGAGAAVRAIALQSDGKVLIGGDFVAYAGTTRNRIARLNADGTLDTGFNPSSGGTVYALATQPGGKILVGGAFASIAAVTRSRLARLNSDGTIDSAFDASGADNSVLALATDRTGKVLAGGSFFRMNGVGRAGLARLGSGGFTITLSSRTLGPGASLEIPSLRGTLTGASIELTSVSGDSYSSDLTLVVTPTSTAPSDNPRNALAQIGGYWGDFVSTSNASTRRYWVPQSEEAAVPLNAGPVSFTSSFDLTANPSYRVWLTNGYTVGSGTFTAIITLQGVTGVAQYPDADGDGYGSSSGTPVYATAGSSSGTGALILTGALSGYAGNSSDCDDANAAVKPGATEVCDASNVDEDCDGGADDSDPEGNATGKLAFYRDADSDGYSVNTTAQYCDVPSGYLASLSNPVDCNDASSAVNPGATEVCDSLNADENCDGLADNADSGAADAGKTNFYRDQDTDGYTTNTASRFCDLPSGYEASPEGDCVDTNNAIYPGAVENCANDGMDNDCDGEANADSEAVDSVNYYLDADTDTYGATTATAVKSCTAVAGSAANNTDCNDSNSAINPGATETCDPANTDENCNGSADNADSGAADAGKTNFYRDQDTDGYTTNTASRFCDLPSGYESSPEGDCVDTNNAVYPGAVENCANDGVDDDCDGEANADSEAVDSVNYYLDADTDTYGATTATAVKSCTAVAGSAANNTDCNDSDSAINPGATELCDSANTDENCNSLADNADSGAADAGKTNFYRDQDTDGYTTNTASRFCDLPSGYESSPEGDCVDTNNAVYRGAVENCANDGVDNDCDGEANADSEATDSVNYYADADNDSFATNTATKFCIAPTSGYESAGEGDCNDSAPTVYPGAAENCANIAVDNDCDGDTSAAEASDSTTYYRDADNDGASINTTAQFCTAPGSGYQSSLSSPVDCNDGASAVYPGAVENCANDGVDNDCDGESAADSEATDSVNYYADADNDSFATNTATKFCIAPTSGYESAGEGDCNDAANTIYPGAVENCANDGVDNDCDGESAADSEAIDSASYYTDSDTDTYGSSTATAVKSCTAIGGSVTNNTDCNDSDNAINPAATEVCDSLNTDENCNSLADNADAGAADAGKTNFYRDQDNDGSTTSTASRFCDLPSGYELSPEGDCVDTDATIYIGAAENCANDGVDNDCDGESAADSEATDSVNYYADADNDGFATNTATKFCIAPASGYESAGEGDCNDAANTIYPGAVENCANDGVDNDCDGEANADSEAVNSTSYYVDADIDSYGSSIASAVQSCTAVSGSVTNNTDCNDSDNAINPAATEVCDPANTDENCNGSADNADSGAADAGKTNFYRDQDTDGYTTNTASRFCDLPSGYEASPEGDCVDTNNAIYPGAVENCANDGVDNDCDGEANADSEATDSVNYYADADNDSFATNTATKFCIAPTSGYESAGEGDCNDAANTIYPGAVENCANDGVDNDCDGESAADSEAIDSASYYTDSDTDTYGSSNATAVKSCTAIGGSVTNNTDCNDSDNAINPAATEICDPANTDENCNSLADNADSGAADAGKTDFYRDQDTDGYTTNTASRFCDLPGGYESSPEGDCVDTDATIYIGAAENCANDGVDNDCDGESAADSEATDSVNYYADADNDGFATNTATKFCIAPTSGYESAGEGDCNDSVNTIYPGAVENCANDGVDNDCDGEANADSEAVNSVAYYIDGDIDGFGSSTATAVMSCTAVGGSVTSRTDCDDADPSVYPNAAENCANLAIDNDCDGNTSDAEASDSVAYYIDSDHDGYGSGSATMSCSAIGGSVTNDTDGCPSDTTKQAPGVCGCGSPDTDANANGIADCADVYLVMDTSQTQVAAGGTLSVRVSSGSSLYTMNRVQLSLTFDASRLEFVSASPVAGGPFQTEYAETADNSAGTLLYTIGVSGSQPGMNAASDLCDLVFSVRSSPSQPLCGAESLVGFAATGTAFTRDTSALLAPVTADLAVLDLDSVAPVFAGVPADVSVACDAGSTYGAYVPAPTVTATDDCDGVLSYSGPSWPADGMFPIGTTTLTWSATDATGNIATEIRTVTVANHQLLNASVTLTGAVSGTHTRSLRIKAGASTQIVPVNFVNGVATVTGHMLPVVAGYSCVEVKDTAHTLTRAVAPSLVGARYSGAFALKQGDSNGDDLVDIVDFGLFLSDRGAGKTGNSRSNFNGDAFVGTADFSFITLNFFAVGETCMPGAQAARPRDRVTVKDLRRAGLGEAAAADINGDGWVDTRDLQLFMQYGGSAAARPSVAAEEVQW